MLRSIFKPFFKSASPSDGVTQPIVTSGNTLATPQYNGNAPKEWFQRIVYAFTKGGINYFCMSNEIYITLERMEAAIRILREVHWGINPLLLDAMIEEGLSTIYDEKIKGKKKLELTADLLQRIKERKALLVSPQLELRLATVKYFDETENIFDYDHTYNLKKLEHWAKNGSVESFFLSLPPDPFYRAGDALLTNLATYLEGETIQNIKNLRRVITGTSMEFTDEDFLKHLALQVDEQQVLNTWSKDQLTNTT
jgi:hypothetical protein